MRKVLHILGQLSDDDVEWMSSIGVRRRISSGEAIVTENQPLTSLMLILDGQFEVSSKGVGTMATLSCGEIVGEISMIDDRPPIASVIARTEGVVLSLNKIELQHKLASDVLFAAHFYRSIASFLAERMRSTVKRMGYGKNSSIDESVEMEGELDINVLDNVHLAGARFDRILKRFMG
jgi:CRP-like cAMP-binding protein